MRMPDTLATVLIGSAALGAFFVARFVAAPRLRPDHPVNRAAGVAEAPLWAIRPDGRHTTPPGSGDGPPGGDGCG